MNSPVLIDSFPTDSAVDVMAIGEIDVSRK
jgi:hypothetical protein